MFGFNDRPTTKSRTLFWVFLSVFFITTAVAQAQTATNLNPTAFSLQIVKLKGQLIDVRTPEEFAQGHLFGAVNINFYDPQFEKKISALRKTMPLYLYCRSGARSGQALAIAQSAGFKNAAHLSGGIMAWQSEGKKVVR